MPIGMPGWPLLACWTASIASVRIVSIASCSASAWVLDVGSVVAMAGTWVVGAGDAAYPRRPQHVDGSAAGRYILATGVAHADRRTARGREDRGHGD